MSDREFAISIFSKWSTEETCFVNAIFRGSRGQTNFDVICLVKEFADDRLTLVLAEDSFVTFSLDLSGAVFKVGDSRLIDDPVLRAEAEKRFDLFVSIVLATGGACVLAGFRM